MTIQDFLLDIGFFINGTLIPFLFALALLFFIYNAAKYFIIGGGDPGAREKARTLALYGIAAFVLLVSIWGIVNLLSRSLGIDNDRSVCPDYMGTWCMDSGDSYDGGSDWFFEFSITTEQEEPEEFTEPFRGPR